MIRTRKMRWQLVTRLGLSATAASLATAAQAQDADREGVQDDIEAADETPMIIVTAERRDQDLQDVPIAATVLSADNLRERAVDDIGDLQNVAPSVAINTVNRSTFVNIRGVGLAQTAPTSVPGVAFYIDGQLIPHEQFIRQSFYDFGSVEVLRGPQGTLTGQNSTGGAIYITTPAPDFDEVFGLVDVTVANYDRYRAVAAINLPFSENVALRVAANHEEMDSFTTNIGPSGTSPGDLNQDGVRANLALRSNDERLRVNLRGEYFDFKSGNSAIKNRNDQVTDDPFVIQEDAPSFLNQEGYRLSGEIRWEFVDGIDLRALGSYQYGEVRDQVDGDRTATAPPIPAGLPASGGNRALYPGRVSNSGTNFDTFVGEVNLISTDDGPFQWVAGAFYLDEQLDVFVYRDNYHTTQFVSSNSDIETVAFNKSKSLFGQINWFLTEQLELIAGARYSWDEQLYQRLAFPGPPLAPDDFETLQESEELTGKIGVSFHASRDTLLYLTASKGYKAGGVNLSPGVDNFAPEVNYVYEAGFKVTPDGRHLVLNGAIFYSDYQGIQYSSLQGGLPVQQNSASAELYGAELELLADYGPLKVTGAIGYLHGRFAEDVCLNNSFDSTTTGGCPPGNQLVPAGRQLPYAPEWTANIGAQYDFYLSDRVTLTPRVQWAYTDMQLSTPFPSQFTTLDSRNIVDARLALDFGGTYLLEAFATNLFDELYIAAQVGDSSSSDGGILYGAPRQYGIRALVRF